MIRFSDLKSVSVLFLVFWFAAVFCTEVEGIVLHPDNEPNLLTWVDRPGEDVIGRWGNDASCVAIAPNYIITTKHQETNDIIAATETVTFAGTEYTVGNLVTHPTADIRLVRLNDANLAEYVSINFDPNETGQVAVIGGFGASRGERLVLVDDQGIEHTYGYKWLYPALPAPGNVISGWGTNKVVSTASNSSELIVCQFDPNSATDYECAIAEHDSGGGWFLPDEDDGWKVIGLSRGVAVLGESWFMYTDGEIEPVEIPQYDESITIPPVKYNHMDAVRISSYAGWIIKTMYLMELQNMAEYWLFGDCGKLNDYCYGADIFRDGMVNIKDFGLLAGRWLERLD